MKKRQNKIVTKVLDHIMEDGIAGNWVLPDRIGGKYVGKPKSISEIKTFQ